MMDVLINLVPGGWLTAIGGTLAAGLVMVWRAFAAGKSAGKNEMKAEKADAYEQHLKDLARAHDARNAVTGGLPEHDPHRRD